VAPAARPFARRGDGQRVVTWSVKEVGDAHHLAECLRLAEMPE
jgi:hypothetical protein